MDVRAYPSSSDFGEYAGLPPILITATSEEARARAILTAESGGYRAVAIPLTEAAERIEIQPQASAIWIELDQDPGAELDELLDHVQANAVADRCPAIITSPLPLIDRIMARIAEPSVELLVDPTSSDRSLHWRLQWRGVPAATGSLTFPMSPARFACGSCRTRSAGLQRRWRVCRPDQARQASRGRRPRRAKSPAFRSTLSGKPSASGG